MYRRILVPIDGSAASSTGLTHALGLAKEQQARVRVLHVVDDRVLLPVMGPYGAPPNLGDLLDTDAQTVNGRSLGRKPTGESNRFRAEFDTVYEPGELVAALWLPLPSGPMGTAFGRLTRLCAAIAAARRRLFESDDAREGITANLQKRKPTFTGR